MIHVICGMMGAGKSTFARKNYRHVVEFEDYGSKTKQIATAKQLHQHGETVAYITCYPTPAEMKFFKTVGADNIKWILINTDYVQCKKNIKRRGRKSDSDVLNTRYEKNKKLLDMIARSQLPFEKINIFTTNECW